MVKDNPNFNKSSHFPFTYGDNVGNDGERLSDLIINKLKDKQVRAYLGCVALAILALGSQVQPTNATPPGGVGAGANPQVPEIPKGQKGSAIKIPGPPQTDLGKSVNTGAVGLAVGVICLNAFWGTPFMAAGCAGILIAMGNKILGN